MLNLRNDQRIVDFCGEDLKPGFFINKKERKDENWVKFDLKVTGLSGKLKTTVIGDYLNHEELIILENERQIFDEKKALLIKNQPKLKPEELKVQKEEIETYVPVDLEAYNIPDL